MNECRLSLLCNTYSKEWEDANTGVLLLIDIEARTTIIVGYTPSGETSHTVELESAEAFVENYGFSGKHLNEECLGQLPLFHGTLAALNTIGSTVYFLRTDFAYENAINGPAQLAQHLFEVISDPSDPAHDYVDDLRLLKNDLFGNTDVTIGV